MIEESKKYRLGDIATFKYGTLPKKELIGNHADYPIFTGYKISRTYPYANCEKGDLIVVARGVGGTGDVKLSAVKCWVTNLSIIIKPDSSVLDNRYFYYKYLTNNLKYLDSGSAQSQITIGDLKKIEVTLPRLTEQSRIASILSSFDDKIELNLQMNRTLEAIAQAIYRNMFNGEPNTTIQQYVEFNPKSSIKKGSILRYIEMSDLPTTGFSISSICTRPFTGGSKFQNYDTLLARITPCLENGKTGFVDFLSEGETAFGSTEFVVMRPKDGVSPFLVYLISRDPNFRLFAKKSMVGTSGRQRVETDVLRTYSLPLIDEFKMRKFSQLVSPLFDRIKFNTDNSRILMSLRDLLVPKLMNGKIRVVKT